jgi:hypothetical protein
VQIEVAGEKILGEVVDQSGGRIRVKFKIDGIEASQHFPFELIKPLAADETKTGTGKSQPRATGGKGPAGPELRTWSDKSGKFKLTAKFLELKDGKVRLEQENGKTVGIPIEKLADADRKLAEELAEEGDDGGPVASEESTGPSEGVEISQAATIEPQDVNWDSVPTADPSFDGQWKVDLDPAPDVTPLAPKAVPLFDALKSKDPKEEIGFFNQVDALMFARDRGVACLATTDSAPGLDEKSFVQRVDIEAGQALETVQFAGKMKALAVSPDGERLLMCSKDLQSQISPRLSLWKFDSGTVRHVATWNPLPDGKADRDAPQFGLFIDANYAVTVSRWDSLVVWKVSTGEPAYSFRVERDAFPAVSPGSKYLAVPTENGLFVLNSRTGEPVGKLPTAGRLWAVMKFSPDGRRLAGLTTSMLSVWDLESGERYREIPIDCRTGRAIDWVSNDQILVNGEKLVDLERRIPYWKYQIATRSATHAYGEGGGVFWYVLTSDDRKQRGIFGAVLPHDVAKKALAAVDIEKLLVLKPGAKVSIDVNNVRGTPEEKEKITGALTAKLRELGVDVASDGPLVLTARTKQMAPEQVSYVPFGASNRDDGQQMKATVQSFENWLGLLEGGQTIWENSSTSGGAGGIISIKQGQSLQQALEPWQRPDLSFYSRVAIPRDMVRTSQLGLLGANALTHQGIDSASVGTGVAPPGPGVGQPGVKLNPTAKPRSMRKRR